MGVVLLTPLEQGGPWSLGTSGLGGHWGWLSGGFGTFLATPAQASQAGQAWLQNSSRMSR